VIAFDMNDDIYVDDEEYRLDYHTIVVAIPNDFDIEKFLSLKEHAGMFGNTLIKKRDLLFLSNAVKDSVIFRLFSDKIPYETVAYFIKILKDLGVIMDLVVSGVKTHNIVSINVLAEELNKKVIEAIKNIVSVEEPM
jgi:hypothetical protein